MWFRKLIILFILVIILAPGCARKKSIKGKEFVPREVLVDVLVDLHLVDGITNDRVFYRRYYNFDSVDVISPIFEKYQISREQFDTTIAVYSLYPNLLDQVYSEVIMRLNVMIDENISEAPEKDIRTR